MLKLSLVAPQSNCNAWEFYLYDRRAAVIMLRRRGAGGTGRSSVGWAGSEQGGWFVLGVC